MSHCLQCRSIELFPLVASSDYSCQFNYGLCEGWKTNAPDNFTFELKSGNEVAESGMQGPHMDRREYKTRPFMVADAAKSDQGGTAYAELWTPTLPHHTYGGQCIHFWYSLKARKLHRSF